MHDTTAHPGEITLDTLDELFAHHRARFGGWSMMTDDADDGDNDEPDDDAEDKGDDDSDDEDDDEPLGTNGKKALERERARNKRLRQRLRDAKPAPPKETTDDDKERIAREADERATATWKPRVVKQAARAALSESGAISPTRLVGLLNMNELDLDDDGEVDGLEDEIDRLKEEFPELFKKKRGAPLETGDRSGGKGASGPKSDSQKQADAILGRK